MNKKVICISLIITAITAMSGCGKSSTTETLPPASVAITPNIKTSQYVSFVTKYKWVNEKTGDSLKFNSNATFSGKIKKKKYSGTFDLTPDKKEPGLIHSNVRLDGSKKEVEYNIKFKDSAHMTITTNKNVSEDFTAEWAAEGRKNE